MTSIIVIRFGKIQQFGIWPMLLFPFYEEGQIGELFLKKKLVNKNDIRLLTCNNLYLSNDLWYIFGMSS